MRKAKLGAGNVVGIDFNTDPAPLQHLRDLTGHVTAGEWVQNRLAGQSQETDKKIGKVRRKPRGMNRQPDFAAAAEILVARARVGNRQEIGRNGAAVVAPKMRRDVMLRRPPSRFVAILQE